MMFEANFCIMKMQITIGELEVTLHNSLVYFSSVLWVYLSFTVILLYGQ